MLPTPHFEVFEGTTVEELDEQVARLSEGADYLIADTPGRDDVFARHLATSADTLVTPINDSFIRSEEHTSELQSLMRISYAVFCLPNKTSPRTHPDKHPQTTYLHPPTGHI